MNTVEMDECQEIYSQLPESDLTLTHVRQFLTATKGDAALATKRLLSTIKWRQEYKPTEIDPSEVMEEAVTGKEIVWGFDKKNRPIIWLRPKLENTKTHDRQIRFVVFNMEKAIKLMPKGVEQVVIIVDYEGVTMFNSPPLSISMRFLSVLGDHYPERLGAAFMINPSWYLWVFFKMLRPFLDPVTAKKIHFVQTKKDVNQQKQNDANMGGWTNIFEHIDESQVWKEYNGTSNFEFNFDKYWSDLND
jgi:hypothetical protein